MIALIDYKAGNLTSVRKALAAIGADVFTPDTPAALLRARGVSFDLVMLTAVWMHLDEAQRRQAMPSIAALVRPGGTVIMKVQHGPVPVGRRMFDIAPEETIELARTQDLYPVLNVRTESSQEANRLAGVSWTNLAFVKGRG